MVLRHLGHPDDAVISVCTQEPSRPFRAETRTVGDLKGWIPPDDVNVWFLPNPLTLEAGVRRKGGEAEIARGLTLYADLDVITPGLKETGLASLVECEQVVKELSAVLGVDPAVVVYSGHGLQPVWRVKDAEPITDGAVAWKTISDRWAVLIRESVRQVNPAGKVDSVFNIDRVLRCPGSTNWKDADNPVPARCEINPDAGYLTVSGLDAVLPQALNPACAALGKGTTAEGQRLLESFRDGPMSPKVAAKVEEVRAAVDSGADRHATTNSAVFGLVRLGTKGERGVHDALNAVEEIFTGVAHGRDDPGEFERSLVPALQKVAGDPNYRPMDFTTGDVFNPDGSVREGSWLARWSELYPSGPQKPPSAGDTARFATVSASELAAPVPPMQWLVRNVWPRNSFGPMGGEKKTLKSYNLMSMAVAVASGLPMFGEFEVNTPGPVLYFAGEGGRNAYQRRLQAIAGAYGAALHDMPLHTVFDVGALDTPDFVDALKRHLDELQPALVILDPLYAFHPSGIEAQNLYERGRMLAEFNALVGGQSALIIADHFKKTGGSALDLDSIAQSGMSQWADSWILQQHRQAPDLDNGEYRLAVEFGSRQTGGSRWHVDWQLPTIGQLEDGQEVDVGVSWHIERASASGAKADGRAERERVSATDAVLQVLQDEPSFSLTVTALRDKAGVNREKAAEAIEALQLSGRIVKKRAKWPEGPEGKQKPVERERIGLAVGNPTFSPKNGTK